MRTKSRISIFLLVVMIIASVTSMVLPIYALDPGPVTSTGDYSYSDLTSDDIARLEDKGYDPSNYRVLELNWVLYAYWNSTDSKGSTIYQKTANDNPGKQYISNEKWLTKDLLPNGTILWVNSGYQYRPEGLNSNWDKNAGSARPGNVSAGFTVIDDSWWGSWTYRAFNFSKTSAVVVATEDTKMDVLNSNFRIYVPISSETDPVEPAQPKSIKILAVGNSFSVDAMQYLWNVMASAGYTDITLGNLYIGGCSLDTHWSNISQDRAAYTYYKNTSGSWSNTTSSVSAALAEQDWDIVTVQQVSQSSGNPSTYGNLDNILSYIKENEPNAKIYWHMTWAYQSDSTHSGFAYYGNSQVAMYNAILSTVQDKVSAKVDGVIPSGIAIQKLRATTVGDTLTRDGYHLNYGNGRYTAALTWLAYIEEHFFENANWQKVVNSVTWTPSSYTVDSALAKESVIASLADDAYTPLDEGGVSEPELTFRELTDEEKAQLKAYLGDAYGDYVILDWQPVYAKFWNSDSGKILYNNYNPPETFMSSGIRFTKSDIPNGSVIWVESGYMYRPDGWVGEGATDSVSRPNPVRTEYVTVDDAWWGSFTYRGFNLSKTDLKIKLDGTEVDSFKIFVPTGHNIDGVSASAIRYSNGFDKAGTKSYVCTRCEGTVDVSAPVVFTPDGYSVKNTNTAIYGGYTVNLEALSAYESLNGAIKFGIIVSNVSDITDLTFNDGIIANDKSIQVQVNDRTFTRFGFSLTGFDSTLASHLDLKIVISAYVIDENGNISFVQKEGAKDGGYYEKGITANGKANALGVMTLERVITLDQIAESQDKCATFGHTEVIDPAVEPTCTETGLTEGKHCSVCNAVLVAQSTVVATGHTPGPEATCTTQQTCTVCGVVLAEATGHTEVIDPEAAPTCTATGLTEGKHCSVCNIIIVAQNTVPALGHTEVTVSGKDATCTETGLSDGKKCTVCGAITEAQTSLPALGHTYGEWVVTKAATETETGTKEHTCTVCSYTESVIINVIYNGSMGSAGRLSDKTIIVSIFANDSGTSWTNSDDDIAMKNTMLSRLGIATEWIKQQCQTYGVETDFIYDWSENSDLCYTTTFSGDMVTMSGSNYYTQRDYINANINSEALKEKYGAQNVIYMLYFNTPFENTEARPWTIQCKPGQTSVSVEVINVFVRYNNSRTFSASSCAHEILHCFGAFDLYSASTTIPQEFVDYCSTSSEYYYDIMRTVNTGDSMTFLEFSALDAYYVGLIESSEDERVKDVITKYNLGKSVHETLS